MPSRYARYALTGTLDMPSKEKSDSSPFAYDGSLYCKVYVDTDMVQYDLEELIAIALEAKIDYLRSIVGSGYDLEVRRNEDCGKADDFIGWQYYLDVGAVQGQFRQAQVTLVARLLNALWSRGMGAVAACDFEEELPRRGGYNLDEPST